ncbi:MAG: peptidoglycan-associated lipoprotein Pal [Saezia sp.]
MLKRFLLPLVAAVALALAGCNTVDLNEYDEGSLGGAGTAGAGTGIGAGTVEAGGLGPIASVSRTIYFDYDSFVVKDENRPAVSGNAKYLRDNPSAKVTLEGHTDERGSTEYNLALGQKRAEAVRQAMLLLGVSEMQMEAISYGKEHPAVYGSSDDAYSKNRRVEFSYR